MKENKHLLLFGALLPLFLFAVDTPVMSWLKQLDMAHDSSYVFLRRLDPFINFIGHGTTLIVAACLLFFIGSKFNGDMKYTGKALMLSFFSAGISVQVLKHLVGRARPRITEGIVIAGPSFKGGYDSFPSGHSAVVFCLAYTLSCRYPRLRGLFYTIAGAIGLMRVVDMSHFPSDVAAGAMLGVIVGVVLISKNIVSVPGEKAVNG